MAHRPPLVGPCLAIGFVLLGGCGPRAEPAGPDVPRALTAARAEDALLTPGPDYGEKLGVPFVRIGAPSGPDAYWVAAAPLPCSAGEHDEVECPLTTSILDEPRGRPPLGVRTALVTDAVSAYRTCALRFGGRLPTPDERRELARTQGLVTILASTTSSGALLVDAIDEWTAEGDDCGNPSKPGGGCRFGRFPAGGAGPDVWASMQACESTPAPAPGPDDDVIPIGGTCAHPTECFVRSPWFPGLEATPRFHRLRCRPLGTPPPRPPARPDVAAFRCILPASALTATPSSR